MKPRILASRSAVVLVAVLLLGSARASADDGATSYMPPNEGKIAAALVARGVIPANATPAEIEAAVDRYLAARVPGLEREGNPLARKRVDANVAAIDAFTPSDVRGKKLGNTTSVAPSSPAWKPLEGAGKLLVILLEFADADYTWTGFGGQPRTAAGPLHNQIPVPDNDYDLWVPDFSAEHFQQMIFTPGGWRFPSDAPRYAGEHRGSMADFYRVQSFGRYTVTGQTHGWYTLSKPEAYYGENTPTGGSNGRVRSDLIPDAVAAVNAAGPFDWASYDVNQDCLIDHPLFIHAGVDESGGGGAQGEDAIWAHSSAVLVRAADAPWACANGLDGIYVYNYTIMPEDGGVGVFAHEFGHDLGLPDEYDTAYSGRGDSIANWSIMSQGSWLGKPAQTQPSDMGIWARLSLGWVRAGDNLAVTTLSALSSGAQQFRLEQAARWGGPGTLSAVRINLPPRQVTLNVPHGGTMEWYGGRADEIDTTLARTVDLTGKSSASLSFWTWYDIEPYWDFGFVQVSSDGGATWTSLPFPGTTATHDPDAMPSIVANLPGFTGSSGGWVQKTADLSAFAGQVIRIQFRYMTDWGTTGAGFFVDDVAVAADGATIFADGAETLAPGWTATGWTRSPGYTLINHYYLAEWRSSRDMATPLEGGTIVNFDAGLRVATQYDPYGSTGNPNQPWYYSYDPGLVLWYRDMGYTDNWTGAHPGHGYLLVVDAHDQARLRPPAAGLGVLPFNTHVQSSDAAFGLDRTAPLTLGYWGVVKTDPAQGAMAGFDDAHTYWSILAPNAGVITPTYGLVLRVLGKAPDGSAAVIGVGTK